MKFGTYIDKKHMYLQHIFPNFLSAWLGSNKERKSKVANIATVLWVTVQYVMLCTPNGTKRAAKAALFALPWNFFTNIHFII